MAELNEQLHVEGVEEDEGDANKAVSWKISLFF